MNRKNEIGNRIIDYDDIMGDDIDVGIEDIENKYVALDIEDDTDLVDEVATDVDASGETIEAVEDESDTVDAILNRIMESSNEYYGAQLYSQASSCKQTDSHIEEQAVAVVTDMVEIEQETQEVSQEEREIEAEVEDEIEAEVEAEIEADLNEEMEAEIEAEMEAEIAADVKGKEMPEDDKEDKSVPAVVNKKKKSKTSGIIYNVVRYAIMAVALYVFGYAAYELTLIYVESREAEELKSETSDMFYVSLEDLQEKYEPTTNAEGETISLENANDGKLFVFDYEKMLSYNSHSKGYIRQDEGEYIDNPIVQHPTDNEYYLTHLADHRKSSIGAIYIDSAIKEGLNAKNCIIYGHNINDRAGRIMFGSLNWYWNKTGYYKEHPTFDIWIENTRYRYYVFATYKTEASGSSVYQYAFSSDEEFMNYIKMCKEKSKYTFKTAPEITKDSHIITLSTCTHTKELRMIVQLVRGEELDIYGNPVESETTEQAGVAE